MIPSVLATSLPLPFADAVRAVAEIGFQFVDVVALCNRPASDLEALAESGLVVSCAAIGRDLPAGQTPDAPDVTARRAAVEAMTGQLADAARLGATRAYVVSGTDGSSEGLERFADSCRALADFAAERMIRLCVEHIPGRALPDVDAVLRWLDRCQGVDTPRSANLDLAVLIDLGHCLLTGTDPASAVRQAGDRLGYVHVDDNDGRGDLHWPLLTGVLTRPVLDEFLAALAERRYNGAVSLELNPASADPIGALRDGKILLEHA